MTKSYNLSFLIPFLLIAFLINPSESYAQATVTYGYIVPGAPENSTGFNQATIVFDGTESVFSDNFKVASGYNPTSCDVSGPVGGSAAAVQLDITAPDFASPGACCTPVMCVTVVVGGKGTRGAIVEGQASGPGSCATPVTAGGNTPMELSTTITSGGSIRILTWKQGGFSGADFRIIFSNCAPIDFGSAPPNTSLACTDAGTNPDFSGCFDLPLYETLGGDVTIPAIVTSAGTTTIAEADYCLANVSYVDTGAAFDFCPGVQTISREWTLSIPTALNGFYNPANPDVLTVIPDAVFNQTITEVVRGPFTIPDANGALTVACESAADGMGITPPTVVDECGTTLTPIQSIIDSPDPITCEGTRTYRYTYTDCATNTDTWDYVYKIEYEPFTDPTDVTVTVDCVADIAAPTTFPTVVDNCGVTLLPTNETITNVQVMGDCAITTYT